MKLLCLTVTKAKPDIVNRKIRKHGAKAVKHGISNEYVCICTGLQRKGNVIIESVNRARPTSDELTQIFNGHIRKVLLLSQMAFAVITYYQNPLTAVLRMQMRRMVFVFIYKTSI